MRDSEEIRRIPSHRSEPGRTNPSPWFRNRPLPRLRHRVRARTPGPRHGFEDQVDFFSTSRPDREQAPLCPMGYPPVDISHPNRSPESSTEHVAFANHQTNRLICRSCSFCMTSRLQIAPSRASPISDCVSQTYPWVPRKASASSPISKAAHHSINS